MAGTIVRFLTSATEPETSRAPLAPRSGTHAGLTYRIEGQGPALILLPFFLAPSQWQPALPELTRHFTVIQLGGPHIGGVAALEDRARAPTYQAMFRTLVDLMAPEQEAGFSMSAAAPAPWTACWRHRLGPQRGSMRSTSIPSCCVRPPASPRTWPSASASRREALWRCRLPTDFDCIFSVTVLEECDADRAIAEMMRVARPGARIGLVVRAIDIAAMVEFHAAGRAHGEGRNTAAVGRCGRRGGCQPVRAHASRGPRRPALHFPR